MKKAIRYSIIVCLVSWVYAAIMIFGLGINSVSAEPMKYTICASLYMLLPLICAVVIQCRDAACHVRKCRDAACHVQKCRDAACHVQKCRDAACHVQKYRDAASHVRTGLLCFKIKPSWLVAWILPVVIVLVTMLVNSMFPNAEFNHDLSSLIPADQVPEEQKEMLAMMMNPAFMIVTTIISGLLAGATINALFAFGEEYGWRNYLVDALRGKKFVFASTFIGIVWGLWHFPLILLGHNYPQHSVAGVFMMVIFCVLVSFVELYFVLKAKSVYPAAIFHGTINAVAGLNVLLVKGGNDMINGVGGLSGFIVLSIVVIVIYAFDRYVCKDNIFSKTIGEVLDNGER